MSSKSHGYIWVARLGGQVLVSAARGVPNLIGHWCWMQPSHHLKYGATSLCIGGFIHRNGYMHFHQYGWILAFRIVCVKRDGKSATWWQKGGQGYVVVTSFKWLPRRTERSLCPAVPYDIVKSNSSTISSFWDTGNALQCVKGCSRYQVSIVI